MIIFHILFHLAYGIISDTDISFSKPSAKSWAWFDFEEGGWIALNLSISSNSTGYLGVYLCGLGDVSSIAKDFKSDFCINSTNAGNYSDCDYNFTYPFYGPDYKNNTDFLNYLWKIRINKNNLADEDWEMLLEQFIHEQTKSDRNLKGQDGSDISTRINKSKLYYFVAANCVQDKVEVSIDYTFMNPGGENLAVGYIEIKYAMNGAQVGWLGIIGLWLLSWILVRKLKLSLIQIYLILNSMVWVAFSWMFKLYWEDYSDKGKSDEQLKNWSMYLFAASECFFFWTVIVICAGSGITKSSIQFWTLVKSTFVVGSLFYCMWLYIKIGDDGLFSLSGSYVLILAICIWDTTKNSRSLSKHIQLISEAGIDPINTPFWFKYRMFRFLRITLIIFLLALSACLIITVFYLEYKPWVAISTHLSIIYQCYLVFFIFFHFRKQDPFFDQIETLSLGENGPLVSLDDILQGMFDRNALFAYSEGMSLPYEKERFLPVVDEVAVIEQPGEIPSLVLGIPIRIINSEEKDIEDCEKGLPYKIEDSCISLEDVKVEI